MARLTDDARDALRRGLRHVYHGDLEDHRTTYEVVEGTFPAGLTGRAFFTVFPYEAVFDHATQESDPHMLTSPGRVLTVDLDRGPEGSIALETRFLEVQSWHVRHLAPHATIRTDFAEISWLGLMNLANTTPVPTFPVPSREGGPPGRRMVLSYDAGCPTEVSPSSLAHVGTVGRPANYRPAVGSSFSPMIMTTGHPVYDPAFEPGAPRLLFAHLVPTVLDFLDVEQSIRAELYMMTWDGEGPPSAPMRVHVDGRPVVLAQACAHQLCLTREHVLVFNANLVLNTAALAEPVLALVERALRKRVPARVKAALDAVWARVKAALQAPVPTSSATLYVIRKGDLRAALRAGATRIDARAFVLEGELTHAIADADDRDGCLRIVAQHNLGADPADQLRQGDRLVDGRRVQRDFLGLFTGTTDLNQVRRHEIDLRTGRHDVRAFPDPADGAAFRFGMNLLPPMQPLAYEGTEAPGRAGDLARCLERPGLSFWVAGGYLPEITAVRPFDTFRDAGHPRLVDEVRFRAEMDDEANTVVLFALDEQHRLDSSYTLPVGSFAGAPVFVPKEGATSLREGWLVVCVWGPDAPEVRIWIFDTARPLDEGPVCRLGPAEGARPMRPGFPLHGAWIDRDGVMNWHRPRDRDSMLDVPAYVKLAELGVMGGGFLRRAIAQALGR